MPRVQKSGARPPRAAVAKPRACRECNGHKIFCSKEQPKCERCRLRSLECVYAGPTMIKVNEDTLRSLKRKLQAYKDLIASLPPDVRRSLPAKPGSSTIPDSNGEDDGSEDASGSDEENAADLTDDLKHIGLENQQSSDNFMRIVTQMSGLPGADADGDDADGSSLAPNPVFYASGALPSRRRDGRLPPAPALPPIDIARQYFAAQHMYIGTIFAFSDPAAFDRQLRAAYARGPPAADDADGCLAYAKMLMILALGRLYSVNRGGADPADDPPGLAFFAHGLALLPDLHDQGSLLGVETLAYAGYFLQNMNGRDAAYLYIGLALRMAITLGLHREPAGPPRDDDADDAAPAREHRRRVWWSIYSLDRILSLKSGYPTSILDGDIGVRMPARLPGEPVESPVAVLRCYTEMSRLLGEIIALVYRRGSAAAASSSSASSSSASPPPHTGATLVATVHAILQSLARWEAALPAHLRLDAGLSRESISVHLHGYQCVTITARPLLFQVAQRRLAAIRAAFSTDGTAAAAAAKARPWQAGLARKTVAVIERCIAAAGHSVRVMAQAAAHNMVATFGYMDGEYALSAAVVLALVGGAFPARADTAAALAQALALLQRIGGLGNRYVAARYAMLARLQALLASQCGEAPVVPDLAGDAADMGPWRGPGVDPGMDVPGTEPSPATSLGTDKTHGILTTPGPEPTTAPWQDVVDDRPADALFLDDDSSLWTAAFANTAGLEFFQFLPETETDMTDCLGL